MTTLFLFAHQDDEMGVLHEIAATRDRGEKYACLYLTNGAWKGVTSERRNTEARKVLRELGAQDHQIEFLGSEVGIADGQLVENLDRAWAALLHSAAQHGNIKRIIMHAWEGGHHDHDAAHLLGLAMAAYYGVLARSLQFPLYRMPASRHLLTFATPLPMNGTVRTTRIPLRRRLNNIFLMRHYRSQWRVMAKLLPHIVWDYMRDGTQKFQPVSTSRVHERPYPGMMLYEMWGLYHWEKFEAAARPFVDRHFAQFAHAPMERRHV